MRILRGPWLLFLFFLVAGCGSAAPPDPPAGNDSGGGGSGAGSSGLADAGANNGELSDAGAVGDPLSPSPALPVSGVAADLADAVLASTTFDDSYNAALDVLAEGGIATQYGDLVKREAKLPAASLFVFPVSAIDLALEAADRRTMATFTLSEFAQMAHELGWPTPVGVAPEAHWLQFLSAWYAAAAADPEAPDSFAVLFIAAMNQKQSSPANIATGTEDPSLIRLSLLEVELLVAAFDRSRSMPSAKKKPAAGGITAKSLGATPCSDFVKQAGTLGQVGQVGAGELTGAVIGAALEQTLGQTTGVLIGGALSALGTVAKVGKLIQQFRYGYVKLDLTTPTPVKKPLKGAANKVGTLEATAGVDPAKYDDKVAAAGGDENSAQRQALADCFNSLNLPTPTDARDIAADAENWRMSWTVLAGGGSQVLWQQGMQWDIDLRNENHAHRINTTTVGSTVHFDILPQASKATVGRERKRKAVFKVQLRRGSAPDLSSLWGSGKAGAAAAMANPIGAVLGIADALTEISTKWALEGASPSAYVQQDLIEIEPTGLVGMIKWTIQGSPPQRDEGDELHHEIERANINQTGYIEIVSEKDQESTAYGSETCTQSYGYGLEQLEIVEGSELVGTRTDRTVRQYSETWQTPAPEGRQSIATVIDGSTAYEGIDPSLLPPALRDMANHVQIYLSAGSVSCGILEGHLDEAMIEYNYANGWQQTESYTRSDLAIVPVTLDATILDLQRAPGATRLVGQSVKESTRQLYGIEVPVVQTIDWNLHWVQ